MTDVAEDPGVVQSGLAELVGTLGRESILVEYSEQSRGREDCVEKLTFNLGLGGLSDGSEFPIGYYRGSLSIVSTIGHYFDSSLLNDRDYVSVASDIDSYGTRQKLLRHYKPLGTKVYIGGFF